MGGDCVNEKLSGLYEAMIRQMGAKIVHSDDAKCFALFDNDTFKGTFYAVEADDNCLITRFDVHVLRNVVLRESRRKSLCISSFSEDFVKNVPHGNRHYLHDKNIAVYLTRDELVEHNLSADGVYKLTTISYLPKYFMQNGVAAVSDFKEISKLVPTLDEGLLAFHLRGLFEDLDFRRASRPSGSLYYQSKAMQALVHVLDMVGELNRLRLGGVEGDDFRLVKQVIEAVEENLSQTPSIEELSRRFYVGHTHLCETFKRTTGLTIGQYARKRKIEFSQVLLRNPEMPIKEIARMMGYGSTESFSAAFKRTSGMSPKAYRLSTLG